jgi:predicted metal-dependent phosphoesterase TrpH
MTPQKIISEAVKKKLDIIAITDHNTAENVPALQSAAKNYDICVIPGMEVNTSEEVHIVALFEDQEKIFAFQELVYEHLQEGENNEELFGMQVVANEKDEVEYFNNRLLIGATSLSFERVIIEIHKLDGLAIAAHIDRDSYSVISQLGFIPPGQDLDALEISKRITFENAKIKFKEYENFPFITSSDSHTLDSIGQVYTNFKIEAPKFQELKLALRNEEGRKIIYD